MRATPGLGPATQDYLMALLDGCDTPREVHEHTGRATIKAVRRTMHRMIEGGTVVNVAAPGQYPRWTLTGAGVLIAEGLQLLQGRTR